MEESLAKEIAQELLFLEDSANKLLFIYKQMKDEREKEKINAPLREILSGCAELLDFVSKKYPHLDPHAEQFAEFDKLDEDNPYKQRIMRMAKKAAEMIEEDNESKP